VGGAFASLWRAPARPWPTVWLVVVVAVASLHLAFTSDVVGEITHLSMSAGAAVVAWIGARRQPLPWRFPWSWVALALSLAAIGDVVYYLLGVFDRAPLAASAADIYWIAAYIALAVGLCSLIVGGRGVRTVDVDGLIDIGSFTVLALIVAIRFTVLGDIVSDSSLPMFDRFVSAAYPFLDAVLVGVIAQAIVSRRLHGLSGVFLSCGVGMWVMSGVVSVWITDPAVYSEWPHVLWMLGTASLAASTWPSPTVEPANERAFVAVRVTDARLLLTLVPLLVPGVIEIWEFSDGVDADPVPLFAATAALVALAFARATRLVKARNRQEAELERSTRYYAALAENSSDAVIVIDRQGRILNNAPNLVAILGRPGMSTVGMDAVALLDPLDRERARVALDRWWSSSGVVTDTEVCATHADGSARWFGVRAANLSADPDVAGMVVNLRDITDRKRAQEQLSHHGFHDSLTGLANRALFHDRLEQALGRASLTGFDVGVVYFDLDGFKVINDTSGHEAGDTVLSEVANRLSGVVRNTDTVSRLGGDEFAILIEGSRRPLEEAEAVSERILQVLGTPFVIDAEEVELSASIGIAIADIASSASSMMRDADVAMYRAKTTGKGKWTLYEPTMRAADLERLELDRDLHHALDKGQFLLVYQPVVDLKTNLLVGFEALIRWNHPTLGMIEPSSFIPIAESNGTIVAIGQWALDEACRTVVKWQRAYPTAALTIAVNLSGRQIGTPDIVEEVATALRQSGFDPSSLILELTEGVLVKDPETAAARLHELHALGVQVAIDDFGTGYSSLSYLRQFPIDILKIDRSFTETITRDTRNPPLVRGLIDLAKTLHLKTIAEGIEHTMQLDSLRDLGCDFGQGFLFAKPLSGVDAATLVAQLDLTRATPARSFGAA
jgi:diguanylate cyclase (GGDEF)-like protein/PAS domain S-box-containing protein